MKHNSPLYIVTGDGVFYYFYWYFEMSTGVRHNILHVSSPPKQDVISKKIPPSTKITEWARCFPKEGFYSKEIQGIDDYVEDNDSNEDGSNDTTKKKNLIGKGIISIKNMLHGKLKEVTNCLGLYKQGDTKEMTEIFF